MLYRLYHFLCKINMSVERVTLPGTELNVSRVCLGCWQFNNNKDTINWDAQSEEQSIEIFNKCLEIGINFFDTAEGYAGSEEVLGKCLAQTKTDRKDIVIATKFGFREGPSTPPYTSQQIREAVDRSISKMNCGYIDLLQVHFPSFLKDFEDSVKTLNELMAEKKIRYYGVSNFGPQNLREFAAAGGKPVSNQMGYNLLWRSAEYGVRPFCVEKGISLLAYSPLQQGLLTGRFTCHQDVPEGRKRGKLFSQGSCEKARHGQPGAEKEVFEAIAKLKTICQEVDIPMAQAALSWVLAQPSVEVVIVGARTPEQMVENSKTVELSKDVINRMTEVTEGVKTKIGCTLDQWAHPDRCQ